MLRNVGGQLIPIASQRGPQLFTDKFRAVWRLAPGARQGQAANAASAFALISSTLPVPSMARYLGAAPGSALAQLA